MKSLRKNTCGNVLFEMALVMLALLFSIFGIAEIGRAMWSYHTLASAIKKGARYASVHGDRCVDASGECQVTVADIASVVQKNAIGIDAAHLQLTFAVDGQTESCGTSGSCLTDYTAWPPTDHNAVGLQMTIAARYPFEFAVPRLWPGHQPMSFTVAARAAEVIEF